VKAGAVEALTDPAAVADRLAKVGLSTPAAEAKAERFARAASALLADGTAGEAEATAIYVPGRIEVLGKHTDYCGGESLIAAAERGLCFVAVARADHTVRALAVDLAEKCEFPLAADLQPTAGHWANYPMTVARRVARNFPGPLSGATIAYSGDLPPAAGMSSSSAVVVGTFGVLSAVNALPSRPAYRAEIDGPETLAGYLGTVENGRSFGALAGEAGVGTFGGSEDHTAILNGRAGALSRYAYDPIHLRETIPLPAGTSFAIAASGVTAVKTGAAQGSYNRLSGRAAAAVERWNAATGRADRHLAAVLASGPDAADRLRALLASSGDDAFGSQELLDRVEHFVAESGQIIPAACEALAHGDLAEFGRQVDRSQHLAETLLGNQVPQTIALARGARELGADAASAFGAGFGGAVWALPPAGQAAAFLRDWRRQYAAAFGDEGERAAFFLTAPGPAATAI